MPSSAGHACHAHEPTSDIDAVMFIAGRGVDHRVGLHHRREHPAAVDNGNRLAVLTVFRLSVLRSTSSLGGYKAVHQAQQAIG
jgi:hypothetical protein